MLRNHIGDRLKSSHVRRRTCASTTALGWCVDGNQNDVGFADRLGHIGCEEEVWLAGSNGFRNMVSALAAAF